ncbi:MAG: ASKHA domain-containing protein [Phycisphaerae bacterium]|nr:ASKHA domain-containing protein [Phycisphaerae bacterium]
MNQQQIKVTFQPQGQAVYVLPGTKIIEAAAVAGIIINTPCGAAGVCGKCRVKIISSQGQPTEADKKIFSAKELKQGWRLACQNTIAEDTVIEVPGESLLSGIDKIVIESDILQTIIPDERQISDDKYFGVAVDIGTTTLAASLINLKNAGEIAVMGDVNPQISLGDDVISRIKYSTSHKNGLAELQKAVIRQINALIDKLCRRGGVEKENIYEITIAGNTTMEYLVCGIDPSPLGQLPFEPIYRGANVINASELKIGINPKGIVYIFPVIGGFVGGDISAGMLAMDLLNQPQPALMIDIGTNGEIVLVKDNKIMAASTAAGPAFEGARISCGMRAAIGAIEKVKLENDCVYNVIGNVKPTGICGSGLIDVAAELLNAGIVDSTGRMNRPEFVIADNVKITQKDIRQIQLAVGAIRAGINIILKQAGIKAGDLKKVFIAGGFGSFIRRNHAQRIGLLPAQIDHNKISFVGNTSLAGAKLALLSIKAREKAESFAKQAKHIELSADSDFQNEFVSAMIFPA